MRSSLLVVSIRYDIWMMITKKNPHTATLHDEIIDVILMQNVIKEMLDWKMRGGSLMRNNFKEKFVLSFFLMCVIYFEILN